MLRALIVLVSLSVAVDSQATDEIRRALEGMQPPQIDKCFFTTQYVVLERRADRRPRTIAAILLTDSQCATELGIFRVTNRGSLRRLATYAGDPRALDLRDVTGNGVPEILVSLRPGNRSTPVVILHWDGKRLKTIGETQDTARYVDLNHDGVPEVVTQDCCETNECGVVVGRSYVQQLRGGRFVNATLPGLASVFVVSKTVDGPETIIGMPYLPDSFAQRCLVRMVNGLRGGGKRATRVTLRARSVKDERIEPPPGKGIPIMMTVADEYVEGVVDLPSRCTLLDITLDGPAFATVAVIVTTVEVKARRR